MVSLFLSSSEQISYNQALVAKVLHSNCMDIKYFADMFNINICFLYKHSSNITMCLTKYICKCSFLVCECHFCIEKKEF